MKIDLNSKWRSWLMIGSVTVILFGMSWLSVSTLTFFISDTGLRFIQVQSLIDHQWQTIAVDHPAYFIDPEFRYVPYYTAFSVVDEKVYLSLTPFFNLLSSFFYVLLGRPGLSVVPVAGCVLTALATYRLARLGDLARPSVAFWGTIFATPLVFYSLELWDHTLGAACALWGVYGIANGLIKNRWSLILVGSIALGLGTGQRPEIYTFAIAVGLSLLLVSRFKGQFAIAGLMGGLLGALPLWGLQFLWFGHPLGQVVAPKITGYGRLESYLAPTRDVPRIIETGRLLTLVEAGNLTTFVATLLSAIGLVSFVFGLRSKKWQSKQWFIISLTLIMTGHLIFAWLAWFDPLSGLLPAFPLLALSVTYVHLPADPRRLIYRFIYFSAWLFLGLMVLLWPTYGGFQWGARYLLPIYPLLCYLALQTYTTYRQTLRPTLRPLFHRGCWLLLGLSIVLQLIGVRYLLVKHYQQIPILEDFQALAPEFIIVSNPLLPSFMAAAHQKNFIYVNNDYHLEIVLARLAQQGIQQVVILADEAAPLTVPQQIDSYQINQLDAIIYEFEPLK